MSKCADMQMKKMLLTLLCIAGLTFSVLAQKVTSVEKTSDHSTYVKGDDFEGVIFSEDYTKLNNWIGAKYKRFTPTIQDIELAESILRKKLKETYKKNHNKYIRSNAAGIQSTLEQYCHQYFGYIDENGKKIIHFNCFPREIEEYSKTWKTAFTMGFDGGPAFWRIEVNISDGILFGFNTNGVA